MEGSRVKTLGPRQRQIQLLHNCLEGNYWLRSREVGVGESLSLHLLLQEPWLLFLSPPCGSPDWKTPAHRPGCYLGLYYNKTPSIFTLFLLVQLAMIKQKCREHLKKQKGKDETPTELDSGDRIVSKLPALCHSACHLKGYSTPTTPGRQKTRDLLAFPILFRRPPFSLSKGSNWLWLITVVLEREQAEAASETRKVSLCLARSSADRPGWKCPVSLPSAV